MSNLIKSQSISPKRRAVKMMKELPEDSSFDDIQYHLYVLQKIDKGLSESKTSKGFSTSQMKSKLGKWIKK
jgi:hypothetical protein